jgi:hypothetical protein
MSGLEFTSNIIDNIFSWPVAVLLIVLILRRQLRELFHTIENLVLEAGGTKVSITRRLELAKESIATAKSETEIGTQQENEYLNNQYSYIVELAGRNADSAIAEAYKRFIQEPVNRLAYDEGLPSAGNPRYLLKELNARGVVPDAIIDTERNLSTVHYQVTSAQRDASPREAIEYAALTREVGRYLNSLRGDQDATPLPEGNA